MHLLHKFFIALILLITPLYLVAQTGLNASCSRLADTNVALVQITWRNIYYPFSDHDIKIDKTNSFKCYRNTSHSHSIDGLPLTNDLLKKYKVHHLYKKQIQKALYKYTALDGQCPTHITFYLTTRLRLSLNGVIITAQAEKEVALSKIKEEDIVFIRIKRPWILGINGNYGQMVIRTR